MKKFVSAAALTTALVASPVFAQDAGLAGPRVELLAGYDIVEGDEGLVYGVAAGYDVAVGQGVIGIEAEINDSTVRETATDVDVVGDELTIGAGRDIYVGADDRRLRAHRAQRARLRSRNSARSGVPGGRGG